MQPCIANVWRAEADEPEQERLPLDRELALDRDLFGVNDASISRATNAPRLIAISSRRVRLVVPAQCATGAVVIHGVNFDALQQRMSSCREGYPRTRVAALGRSLLVARGQHSALALLRSASPEAERPDQLVALPRTVKLTGPAELEMAAPAIVIVGSGAVAIAPGITVFPDSGQNIVDHSQRFRLPSFELSCGPERELDALGNAEGCSQLRVAGHDEAFCIDELPRIAKAVLGRVGRRAWFVPALADECEARLCLLYERRDGSTGGSLSPADVESWLGQLHALSGSRRAPPSQPASLDSAVYKVISGHCPSPPPAPAPSCANSPAPSHAPLAAPVHFGNLQTHHPRFAHDLLYLESMRKLDLGLLLLGESGTGKEYLAAEVHARSKRAAAPFVPINVASLTESLIESELFGHVKGAYTGTQGSRDGAFVTADGGTLLLDEIADAPLRVQLALLRVLQSRRIRPVGADRERTVDVRVIAATSRDLPQLMRDGHFREDLYHRIAEMTLTVPPLRERLDDLPNIARTLLKNLNCRLELSGDALAALQQRRWSGNIRALGSALRQAAQLAEGADAITAEHVARLPGLDEPTPVPTQARGHVAAAPGLRLPVEVPPIVRATGERLWHDEQLPELGVSGYERRALHRAALIYLAAQRGKDAFSVALVAQWRQLFGARWSQTENHRGLREVLRLFDASLCNEAVRGWVLGVVECDARGPEDRRVRLAARR